MSDDRHDSVDPSQMDEDSGSLTWEEQIEQSEVFLVVATPDYFVDPIVKIQRDYAKSLKKPFRVLLLEGTEIPIGYFDGVEDILIESFDSTDSKSTARAFIALIGENVFFEGVNFLGIE